MSEVPGPEILNDQGLLAEWYLIHRLDHEIERARRYHRPLSVLVAVPLLEPGESLSFAAKHAAAAAAQHGCRTVDLVGWLGAETILMVLPETDRDGADLAAARLRDEFTERSEFIGGQRWKLFSVPDVELAESGAELMQRVLREHIGSS